ncbi:MAG: DUF3253 domain-containing protein [Pseudomonadota bacterium]
MRTQTDAEIADAILQLCTVRGPDKTICPSEAARAVTPADAPSGAWRAVMDDVRRVGADLAARGRITVMQKGAPVDPTTARGAIRYRIAGDEV